MVASLAVIAACNRPIPKTSAATGPIEHARIAPATPPRSGETTPRESRDNDAPVVPDAALTEKVRDALIEQKGLIARDLRVTAKDGVVTLAGKIEERSDQDRMMLVAMSVEGVRSVISHLILERPS